MDAPRFDAITKAWTRTPRRRVLGGLVAGALAPLLGLSRQEASAQTCQRSGDCPGDQICKNNTCVSKCGNPGKGCDSFFPFGCDNDGSCFCGKKPGGGGLCLQGGAICPAAGCRRQSDCPEGTVCGAGCGDDSSGECTPKFACLRPCGG